MRLSYRLNPVSTCRPRAPETVFLALTGATRTTKNCAFCAGSHIETNMNKTLILAVLAIVVAGGAYVATRPDASNPGNPGGATAQSTEPAEGEPIVQVSLPETLSSQARIGERGFNAVCADCHGVNAGGKMGFGPPLVHKIYEPSHHANMSFQLAVQNGVAAHHWKFGNMPPQEGLTPADVKAITTFVRELQRANGIN